MVVKVEILSVAGCADTPATIDLVQATADRLQIEINLSHIIIHTQDEAEKSKFPGSPTVRLNGLDIDPAMRETSGFGIT
jgi:hypothetical protein